MTKIQKYKNKYIVGHVGHKEMETMVQAVGSLEHQACKKASKVLKRFDLNM